MHSIEVIVNKYKIIIKVNIICDQSAKLSIYLFLDMLIAKATRGDIPAPTLTTNFSPSLSVIPRR